MHTLSYFTLTILTSSRIPRSTRTDLRCLQRISPLCHLSDGHRVLQANMDHVGEGLSTSRHSGTARRREMVSTGTSSVNDIFLRRFHPSHNSTFDDLAVYVGIRCLVLRRLGR